jgi:hypothetical protein
MQNLEASIFLCDPLNPGFGYQIRITRSALPGAPVDVLFTSRDPVTDKDLLTYEQCLDVLARYRSAPRTDVPTQGFILRAEGSTRHFFSAYIRNEMQYVEDRNYAWFTTDHHAACMMALDLLLRGEHFEVVPHMHDTTRS